MEFGLFLMPLHPPHRSIADSYDRDLEGYELEGKGYFGPGELPLFDRQFFNMPHGRAEAWAFEELVAKIKGSGGVENPEGREALEVFKDKLGVALSLSDDVLAMELEDYIA